MQVRSDPPEVTGSPSDGKWARIVLIILALLVVVEFGVFILYRQINLDEGWYMLAGRLVMQGEVLYRDFAYTQTPLLPYVYGVLLTVLGEGLYQGRLITALFGMGTFALSTFIATRRAGLWAGVITLLLLMTSLYAIAQFSYTATYSLAGFLIVAALAAVVLPGDRRLQGAWRVVLGTALLWLAVATRLSVIAALIPYLFYLIVASAKRRRAILTILATSLAAIGVFLGLFLVVSGRAYLYDIFGFHTDRILDRSWWLGRMIKYGGRTLYEFMVPWLTALVGLTLWIWQASRSGNWYVHLFELAVGAMALALYFIHLIPQSVATYYHALEVPLLSILGGILLYRLYLWSRPSPLAKVAVLTLIPVLLLTNIVLQTRAIQHYRIMGPFPFNQVQEMREVAAFLRQVNDEADELLTFHTPLAVEAGMEVPHGFEMSIFSYQPTWTSEQARQFNVLNNELLLEQINHGDRVAVLTDFDLDRLYTEPVELKEALTAQYRLARSYPQLDPYGNSLHIFLPRHHPPPAPTYATPVKLDDGIRLMGYDMRHEERNNQLHVELTWQADSRPGRSYTAFVHLLDQNHQYVVGWDNPPCRDSCPTETWDTGEILRDGYTLQLPDKLDAGPYVLEIGMYNSEDQQPLKVLESSAPLVENRIILTEDMLGTAQ